SAGLFADEAERRGLIEEAQLAARVLRIGRVHEDPAVEERAVEVRDERTDVARGERLGVDPVETLQVIDQPALFLGPERVVPFVAAVDPLPRIRDPDVRVAEEELADRRVERESVHAVPGRVDEHRRRTVDDVPRRDLLEPRLEAVLEPAALGLRDLAVHGEDRADRDVRFDVRRPVERIVEEDVVPDRELLRYRKDLVRLLRGHAAEVAAVVERLEDDLVGVDVELLLLLAVDVRLVGRAEDVDEPGLVDLPVDELRGERDVVQNIAERAGRLGVLPLLFDDVAPDRDHGAAHGILPWSSALCASISFTPCGGSARAHDHRSVSTERRPSRIALRWMGRCRSVRRFRIPLSSRRSMTAGCGWPYRLCLPTEISAISGLAAARTASDVDVPLPWCATLSTAAASPSPYLATSVSSTAVGMSP